MYFLPITWIPNGKPSGLLKFGIFIAGTPHNVQIRLGSSVSFLFLNGAWPAVDKEIKISNDSKDWSNDFVILFWFMWFQSLGL